MNSAKQRVWISGSVAATALSAVLFLTGCAEKGPILLKIGYQAPAEKTGAVSRTTVGISPLRDVRGVPASVMGRRKIPSGLENELVVQGTVAEAATTIMKEAFAARGIAVKDVVDWDLTPEGIQAGDTTILLGGEIKTLWLESGATSMKTHVKASVQIRITVGDRQEKKIIRTIDVSSKLDQDMFYSRERLETAFSEALSSAVNQIFQDEELKKRFQ